MPKAKPRAVKRGAKKATKSRLVKKAATAFAPVASSVAPSPVSMGRLSFRPHKSSAKRQPDRPDIIKKLATVSEEAAHRMILSGIPMQDVIDLFGFLDLSRDQTADVLNVNARTLARWEKDEKKTLEANPGNRFYRFTCAIQDGMDLFGSREATLDWFHTERPELGGHRPIDLMQTDPGAQQVEDLMGRIRYGVYT